MTQKQNETAARAMKGPVRFAIKSVDEGTVTAVFATFNVKDLDGDVTLPGAFEDGAEVLISAYNHGTWGYALPVGKGVIHADKNKAWMDGQFWLDIPEAKATFLAVKNAGDLQEWSYGYKPLTTGEVTNEMAQNGVYRVLEKVKVFEVAPVMVGAGIGTETVSIKSASGDGVELPKPPVTAVALAAAAAPTPEEIAAKSAKSALLTDAMREFAKFQKTQARLIVGQHAA